MPKKNNKYIYGWKFYCDYGQGWEYEVFEDTYAGMVENRKAYRENSPYPLKITKGRVPNDNYVEPTVENKLDHASNP
jgi:hypothetical protein